jgi:hypothetical protein
METLDDKVKDMWRELEGLSKTPYPFVEIKQEESKKIYIDTIDKFVDRHRTLANKWKNYDSNYKKISKNSGREIPILPNLIAYYFIMIILIALEVPTNYTTIEQFLHKPIISLFATIAIGMLLVFIAHSHGKFFKQITYINRLSNTGEYGSSDSGSLDHRVSKKMRYFYMILGYLGLIVIFYSLYSIRLQYFNSISGIEINDPFTDADEINTITSTVFTKVHILMMINFSIYFLGVVVSYFRHCYIPGYQEAYLHREKLQKIFDKEYMFFKNRLKEITDESHIKGDGK